MQEKIKLNQIDHKTSKQKQKIQLIIIKINIDCHNYLGKCSGTV
jgi:methylmalonyl-CoA mutase cobalamin-binding subunit